MNNFSIEMNLDEDFAKCLSELRAEYGEKFERLNGLHNDNLNFTGFIDNFIDSNNVANATIDGNANASTKDICSLEAEMSKPHKKLLSFNKIFYELKKEYGLSNARKWLKLEWNGAFYLHDAYSSSLKPYCFAYDLEDLVNKGLFFVDGFGGGAPKHLTTFTAHVKEFVSWVSNRTSGACGLPSFLIYSFYFWKHDVEDKFYLKSPEYYRDQSFQEIIFGLNQPYLRVNQSAFTNFTIMDKYYLEEMFGERQYPDGTYVIDYIDELIEYQKAFMEVVSKVREQNMFTFPVLTFSLLKKKEIDVTKVGDWDYCVFEDEEFARWCSKHNMKWGDSNFFSSEDITSLSSCCFSGEQLCLTKSSNGVALMTFKELYESKYNDTKRNFTVFHNGSWVKCKTVRLGSRTMYKIVTSNNKEMIVTDNHIFPTMNGDKRVDELTTEDYLMFNCRELDTFPEKDLGLTYEEGFLIGMYLGDGSTFQLKGTHTPFVLLSLNCDKYNNSLSYVNKALNLLDAGAEMKLDTPYNNVYPTKIHSQSVYDFIKTHVSGSYCYEKELNMDCLLQSAEFRKGILDGYYETDGGNSNRIYTTSKKLATQVECLITSLGMNSIIDLSDRTDEPIIIRGEVFNRNYPLYCVRWYEPKNKRSMGDVYTIKNNGMYFKITSVCKCDYEDEYVYCFEMENKLEPYFTLPNGVITHNCRLVNDFSKLKGFINSIGGTQLKIGSVKVNTINLARIAYESGKDSNKYFDILRDRVDVCLKTLNVVRHIIKRNVEKGLLPNYYYGLVEMEHQYNTIGVNGMFEAINYMGGCNIDALGNVTYNSLGLELASNILDKISEWKEEYGFDYSVNVEAVPAERCAVISKKKDSLLFPESVTEERSLYGNQWIPLDVKTTLSEKIRLGSILDAKCGGGQIMHANVSGRFTDEKQAWRLLNEIVSEGVIYFAFNMRISTCKNGHGFVGSEHCPICGEPVADVFTRVVGFYTPVSAYSTERSEEYGNRYWYDLND